MRGEPLYPNPPKTVSSHRSDQKFLLQTNLTMSLGAISPRSGLTEEVALVEACGQFLFLEFIYAVLDTRSRRKIFVGQIHHSMILSKSRRYLESD